MVTLIVLLIAVVSIVIQLSSRRKDKYQRIVHSLFYRTQRPGAGAWGLVQPQRLLESSILLLVRPPYRANRLLCLCMKRRESPFIFV